MRLFKNKTKQTKATKKRTKPETITLPDTESFTALLFTERQRQDDRLREGVQGQPGEQGESSSSTSQYRAENVFLKGLF